MSSGPVHCVENHDGALPIWRGAGVARRVLVHVDAHHDMYGGWIDRKNPEERARINIANFVYAALEEDLVREVVWVVPDQTWATPADRRGIVRALKGLEQGASRNKPTIRVEQDRITGSVLGRRIQACTVANLPALDEAVLLDIDIDYLVIPNVGYREIDVYGSLPWCWPVQLLAQLKARGLHTDLTTIAYSVEGGYTPLQWKYLGDELAQRLQSASPDLAWTDHLREAAQAAARGDAGAAETHCLAAHKLRPELAPPCYHLAHLFAATGRIEAAREYLSLTRKLDPSYRGPYNNAGWWYLEKHRHDQARSAFARTLSLDPADAYAHLGCGLLAVQEKDWPAAESSLRQALALDDRCVEAYRALGNVLARRLAYPEAVDAYERSLKLALSGHRALTNQMSLSEGADSGTPWDPDHGAVYADLARIHMATGAWAKAITDYRMAIAAGTIDAAGAWTHLAVIYFRTACWRNCVEAIWQASKRMPRLLARSAHGLWVGCRAALRHRREARSRKRPADTALALWI